MKFVVFKLGKIEFINLFVNKRGLSNNINWFNKVLYKKKNCFLW